jgi:ATP-binding cassette subfamily C protein
VDGELTIGMLVAFQGLMASFLAPVSSLVPLGSTIQELQGDLQRLDDVLANPTSRISLDEGDRPAPGSGAAVPVRLQGRLEVRNLTFGYSPLEEPLIRDFSLRVEPGQRVALVGGSGSGKSTLVKVITGLYEPWQGEILFDSQPRQQVAGALLDNSVSMVDQDILLFEGTVRDNLTLWDRTVAESSLMEACKHAAVHDVVLALPGGLDAVLQEGGANLSGGQRQRLEIARALVNNPSLMVLDEATSALDAETEQVISENLRQRGCTCILVAHRLSTVRDCDEIIVLSRGRVVERGTHEQMWAAGGTYARLIQTEEQ